MAELTQSSGLIEERVERVARSSYGRLVALLAAGTRDLAGAEDALGDAFERALTRWPREGVPDNPEAWLLTVARNRQRDRFRAASRLTPLPDGEAPSMDAQLDAIDVEAIPDRRLALLFACAHPAIDRTVRTPLMLQVVLGFRTEQVAAAFAIPAPTMAQRLVRAKRRIRDAGVPFAIPDQSVMPERMREVLEAVYGAFAIDWKGIAGVTERVASATEALCLAETLAELAPEEPEALGLAALVCLSLARAPARVDEAGVFVPLQDQDTSLWDEGLIDRGERHLMAAHTFERIGRFQLEAAIQSVHCARRRTGRTDWDALRTLYRGLIDVSPSLGAAVAYAVVIGESEGAAAGLASLDAIDDPRAARFQPAWAARGHLSRAAGDEPRALDAYERAIALTTDPASRAFLQRQLGALRGR